MSENSDKIEKSTDKIQEEESTNLSRRFTIEAHKLSSPFLPPEILKSYDEIKPGIVDEIFDITIKSINHQLEMEKEVILSSNHRTLKGQTLAFIISLTGIIGAVVCAFLGEVTIGSIIGGSTLISLVPNFITGAKKKKQKSEDQESLET
jgi:uncharacterized membrane protein